MGWTIADGARRLNPSYTTVSNLAQHLAHVLPAGEWAQLTPIFQRRTGDPFTVTPRDAASAARLLRKAAGDWRMPPDWADLARRIADAADKAAAAGRPWRWS